MSSTINNLTQRSPIDGTEFLVLATSGANWKGQLAGQSWVFGNVTLGSGSGAANDITVTGATSGNNPLIQAVGTDANVGLILEGQGSGNIFVAAQQTNFFTMNGASTGNAPSIVASGSDPNIQLNFISKGSGAVVLISNGNNALAALNGSSSVVNYFIANGSTTTNPVIFQAAGNDTDITLQLLPKGAGLVQFAGSSFSADGTVATVLGSLGPTGANTTVQEWLTIKNASGTTRYIPCF